MTNIEKVLKIAELAMEINGEEYKNREKPCAFLRISPHVNDVDVDIYRGGYGDCDDHESLSAYYSGENFGFVHRTEIQSTVSLEEMIRKLQEVADEINPPELRPDIVEV